jgi:hypothetical protein
MGERKICRKSRGTRRLPRAASYGWTLPLARTRTQATPGPHGQSRAGTRYARGGAAVLQHFQKDRIMAFRCEKPGRETAASAVWGVKFYHGRSWVVARKCIFRYGCKENNGTPTGRRYPLVKYETHFGVAFKASKKSLPHQAPGKTNVWIRCGQRMLLFSGCRKTNRGCRVNSEVKTAC